MPASSFIDLSVEQSHQLIELASAVIKQGAISGELQLPSPPFDETLFQMSATFVTVYLDGKLKGCIGCCEPKRALWLDVCHHAFASSFDDRRFSSVTLQQLTKLSFDISILSPLQPIENKGEQALCSILTPSVDGLLIEQGKRGAVFLPTVWQSLPRAEDFVLQLKLKAGWSRDYWHTDIKLFRFTTEIITAKHPFVS